MNTTLIGMIAYFVIGFCLASIIAYFSYKYNDAMDIDALPFLIITILWIILIPVIFIGVMLDKWLKILGGKK